MLPYNFLEWKRKLQTIVRVFIILTLSGCVSIPAVHFTVGHHEDSTFVNPADNCDTVELPEPQVSLSEQGTELDSTGFSLMTWNMLKGKEEGWEDDFQDLSSNIDLVVLQEAFLTDDLQRVLQDRQYTWDLAVAFEYFSTPAGVLTASKIEPHFLCMSRAQEPLIRTPKTVLITQYPLSSTDQSLLVANIHSINFSLGTSEFSAQLQQMVRVLTQHQGPLIIAGDFNTWSDERMALVNTITRNLNMKAVSFREDNRVSFLGHTVDHIYYRGLEPGQAVVHKVTSSDHNPMLVTFRLADDQYEDLNYVKNAIQ